LHSQSDQLGWLALAAATLTTTTETTKAVHVHPLVKVEREARQQFVRIGSDLGLVFSNYEDGCDFETWLKRQEKAGAQSKFGQVPDIVRRWATRLHLKKLRPHQYSPFSSPAVSESSYQDEFIEILIYDMGLDTQPRETLSI
jgi:hypothetical protein